MKHKNYFLIFSFVLLLVVANNITTFGQTCRTVASASTFTEDFDSLANTGSSTIYPSGFIANRTPVVGPPAIAADEYTTGTGSSSTGAIYSFGNAPMGTPSTERALGSQTSGTTDTITLGGCITNTSGASFGSIVINYTGEQWRTGTVTGAPDNLVFEYSTNATSITDGAATWTAVSALDFVAPQTPGTSGALDGNDAANQTTPSSIIAVVVNASTSFYFRWTDTDVAGSDHGLSIDNFTLSARIPTAGDGTIVGRARTENGRGLKHVVVMLTGGELQEPLYATTNQFGYYRFEDVQVGQSYVLQATSGRYQFQNSTRLINLDDNLTNEDFILESFPEKPNNNRTVLIPKSQSKSRKP